MRKYLLFVLLLSVAAVSGSFAQNTSLKEKLKSIEGKAQKIEVKTDKGTVTFTGDDAQELLKRLKEKGAKKVIVLNDDDFEWNGDDDAICLEGLRAPGHAFKFFNGAGLDSLRINLTEFLDNFGPNKITKKVVIDTRDGMKSVIVTTKENGTEKIETYEGADAEKYIQEHKESCDQDGQPEAGTKKKMKKVIIEDKDQK